MGNHRHDLNFDVLNNVAQSGSFGTIDITNLSVGSLSFTGGGSFVLTGSLAVSSSNDSYFVGGGGIGIGTTTSTSDLHVNAISNVGFTLQHASRPTIALTDGTNYAYIGLDSGGQIITGAEDNDLAIRSPDKIRFATGASL
jgi:hypothetical protein